MARNPSGDSSPDLYFEDPKFGDMYDCCESLVLNFCSKSTCLERFCIADVYRSVGHQNSFERLVVVIAGIELLEYSMHISEIIWIFEDIVTTHHVFFHYTSEKYPHIKKDRTVEP